MKTNCIPLIYVDDIGMEFGMEKFTMQIMKSEKNPMTETIYAIC